MPRPATALLEAFKYVTNWRTAIDGGANVGRWSLIMAERFERVLAFEPNPYLHLGLERDVPDNVHAYCLALADRRAKGRLAFDPKRATKISTWYVDFNSEDSGLPPVEAVRLDDVAYVDRVDLLKLDVEGAELLALRGARRTIERCRPVLIIEQSKKTAPMRRFGVPDNGAVEFCLEIGARLVEQHRSDFIFVFD